ncbi:MAG TPA: type II toxin-antitoxin system prevent-host-death family antitoxin [Thermoanaerobaculia bacterium]
MDDQDNREYSRAPELEDLLTLCKALNAEGVRYVLIGGFAVILHGFVRATKDIDLLIDASSENVQRLKRAMAVLPDNAIALAEARSNLPQLVRQAESGEPIELTRRGESVAVLIRRKQYDRLASRSRRFSEAWKEFTREVQLSELAIDPDAIFSDLRDARP